MDKQAPLQKQPVVRSSSLSFLLIVPNAIEVPSWYCGPGSPCNSLCMEPQVTGKPKTEAITILQKMVLLSRLPLGTISRNESEDALTTGRPMVVSLHGSISDSTQSASNRYHLPRAHEKCANTYLAASILSSRQ